MKITKTQLKQIINEELGKSIQGLNEQQRRDLVLSEEIRKLGWTPLEQKELRQLIAEGPIGAATEFMTGAGTSVADIKDTDFSTNLGKLEGLVELLEWIADWFPKFTMFVSRTEDADAAGGTKLARAASRIISGPVILVLKALKGLLKYMQKNPDIAAKLEAAGKDT